MLRAIVTAVLLCGACIPSSYRLPPPKVHYEIGKTSPLCLGAEVTDSMINTSKYRQCRWLCAEYHGTPRQYVSVTFHKPAGEGWSLVSKHHSRGICPTYYPRFY